MRLSILKLLPVMVFVLILGYNLLSATSKAVRGPESAQPEPARSRSNGGALFSKPAETTSTPPEQTVEQVFKNIQVFKGMPRSQFTGAMDFMMAALGVNCNHCHVERWESDDKPTKQITREMVLMTRDINEKNFGGMTVVNCATCHQGRPKPVSAVPLNQVFLRKKNAEVADPSSAGSLPTAEQVIDKYVRAVGGRAAFERLNSRFIKSSQSLSDGTKLSQEVYMKAPNKAIFIDISPGDVSSIGFDGAVGWSKKKEALRVLKGSELNQLRFNSEFNSQIRLKELFTAMRVTGEEEVGGRETYVVEAAASYGDPLKLYFDTRTGLLLRVLLEVRTAFGSIPEQTDFSDYRRVDGVKLPFLLRRTGLWDDSTTRITEVRHNVTIDDAKFNPPSVK
jgi:hypothetical protein